MTAVRIARVPFGAMGAVICLIVGLAVAHRVILEPGVVGLNRDWAIPPSGLQMAALAQQTFDGWYKWGLGLPAIYPTDYALEFALGIAAALGVTGGALSKALVVFGPAVACGAGIYLARRLALAPLPAVVCGLVYALNPVVLNKLVSGQLTFIVGYALFPLALGAFASACLHRRWLSGGIVTGACLALAAFQIQLGFLDVVLIVGAAIVFAWADVRTRILTLLVALTTLAIVEGPVLVGLHENFGTLLFARAALRNDVAWIAANSAPPAEAFKLAGYIVQYDLSAVGGWYPVWSAAGYVIAVVALLGVLRAPAGIRVLGLSAGTIALLAVTGVYSPAAPVLIWLFGHVAVSQAFLEVYDVMAVLALVYAIGVGFFFAWPAGGWTLVAKFFAGVAVAAFVAPLFSGDCGGQLRVHAYDRELVPAYDTVLRSQRRIVWWPMDQPLSFRGGGAGVEPMNVTAPGSFWRYSLSWPLTAVDMQARSQDWRGLVRSLDALGVGSFVERSDFRSELYRFLLGPGRHPYLERPVRVPPLSGLSVRIGNATRIDTLAGALPLAFSGDGVAFVPRRLSAIAPLAAMGVVPVAFEPWIPQELPCVVMRDRADEADEELALSGIDQLSLPASTYFATQGFAPLSWSWWYRPELADVSDGLLAIGPQHAAVAIPVTLPGAVAEVSWVATSAGGRFLLSAGDRSSVIDTNAPRPEWRSAFVPVGNVRAGEILRVDSLDQAASVAIRGVRVVDAATVARARAGYKALLRRARYVGYWQARGAPYGTVRSGQSPRLGTFAFRREYRLDVQYHSVNGGYVVIADRDGNTVAYHRLGAGEKSATIAFAGVEGPLRIDPVGARVLRWRLGDRRQADDEPTIDRSRAASATFTPGQTAGTTAVFSNPRSVAVFNVAYSESWISRPLRRHFPTALGTNAWLIGARRGAIHVEDRQTPVFRLAYVIGLITFAAAALSAVRGAVGGRREVRG